MRIVVKAGPPALACPTGCPDTRHVEIIVKTLSDRKNAGYEIVLVSSGAIGMGVGRLSLKGRPEDMPAKQAGASAGQCELMHTYDRLFGEYNHVVGQILLTGSDFSHADRKANFENTILRLSGQGAIPVVNENDTIVTDEISVGDNDTLAREHAEGKGSSFGSSGMITKLNAAQTAMQRGVAMAITNGARPRKLYNIVEGEAVSTRFIGKESVQ